jgi:hypothetical protein
LEIFGWFVVYIWYDKYMDKITIEEVKELEEHNEIMSYSKIRTCTRVRILLYGYFFIWNFSATLRYF